MAGSAEPIHHIHVSEQGGFGFTHLDAGEEQVAALGQVITARNLGTALLNRLNKLDDIHIIAPGRVQWVNIEDDLAHIGLDGKTLSSRLLVAADGGNSFVRQQLCFDVKRREYGQSAITANITPGRPHKTLPTNASPATAPWHCCP